jgi:hypothetical protein
LPSNKKPSINILKWVKENVKISTRNQSVFILSIFRFGKFLGVLAANLCDLYYPWLEIFSFHDNDPGKKNQNISYLLTRNKEVTILEFT